MTELERKRKFPIAFWVCGCTEIFERLSFYLGRSLILVFVTTAVASGGLGLANTTGAKMQADLTAYSYLAGFLGAFITDKLVGPDILLRSECSSSQSDTSLDPLHRMPRLYM